MINALSILVGIYTVCTQSWETVRICTHHYTQPSTYSQVWADYDKFRRDTHTYTNGRIHP